MRFGTTSYFLGIVKLTSNFKSYYTKEKKSRVIFCETYLAPAKPKSQKRKPLTKIRIYFWGALGNQAEIYYRIGDYVLVQGRLKLVNQELNSNIQRVDLFPTKEYQLNVIKMSLIRRSDD
jgi:single-stranded DNA-binding protein